MKRPTSSPTRLHLLIVALSFASLGFTWPWEVGGPWPSSSETPIRPLDHPTLEQKAVAEDRRVRFAAYGDQRALADGEWQEMIARIAALHAQDPLDFIVDTGDIVQDGRHSDQYWMLREILAPVVDLPLLVGVGNHEVRNNEVQQARDNTGTFLSYLDPEFSSARMYYRKDAGPVRFLFLDSNDLVYGEGATSPPSRVDAQVRWLAQELEEARSWTGPLVVVLHHPFVQSSRKHAESAAVLWSYRPMGPGTATLPELLLDAGVDLVLVGHTHTYERFVLGKGDRTMDLVNLSGRPRTALLWIGDGARRARDIAGKELEHLRAQGWRDLDGWTISQEAVMVDDEENQFAIFEAADSTLTMSVHFLGEDRGAVRDSLTILEW